MSLMDFGRIMLRRGWIVLLLALLAGGSAYVLSQRQTPIYRSLQKVLIQPARTDYGLTESSRLLLNSYSEYLRSTFRANAVIDKLQLDMTPDFLLSKAEIRPDQLTLTIQISIDLPNGDLANDVARTWAEELVLYRNQENQKNRREDQVNAFLQDKATYSLWQPRPTINAAVGALAGAFLGALLIFGLEVLESRVVRRRDDLERGLELPVLATIPEGES